MHRRRARLTALATAALLTMTAFAAAPAPAGAVTFDDQPVRTTAHFTVAGHPYTLRDVSVGSRTQEVRIGQHSGRYRSDYRLTFKNDHGRILTVAHRGLFTQDLVLTAFDGARFRTTAAFAKTRHRVLHVSAAAAKQHWLTTIRIESVGADLESTISAVLDYLDALQAGSRPDFDAISPIHSEQYPGSVTISGTDTKHWSVIVRDTKDGYGEFYDQATGGGSSFRF